MEAVDRPTAIDGAAEALAALLNPPPPTTTLPPLRALKLPTLILWGKYDRVVPPAIGDAYAKAIAGARKIVLENSGHLPHVEEPDLFTARITEFVTQFP